mmetsp:Transcript_4745/g.16678  ORF Transcript_4745/g.16678 Transcript_4745/m.16678 type:complete len:245 (-) Transcript_4745:43-777(-)
MAAEGESALPESTFDDEEEPDQTELMHLDPQWLRVQPITRDSALDYFAASAFYDRGCDNEQCFMQRQRRGNTELLSRMTGIQYQLVEAHEPALFVIRKVKRMSPTEVQERALYYLIHGATYQAPSLLSVMKARMMNSLHLLQQSLGTLSKIRNAEDDPQEATAIRMADKSKYVSEQRQEWAPSGNDFRNAYRMILEKFPTTSAPAPAKQAAGVASVAGQKRTFSETDAGDASVQQASDAKRKRT